MSGTNHVTGGIVFTGIFASFWNINIFARPELLAATGFFAILPDIDHTKSPIGKAFYPLAKWLDKRFGHRTITHSLAVYIPLIGLVAIIQKLCNSDSYTLVFAFAYFSHLLFDMLTKQGVPLFYPFKRNPCVIPGNPEMRLRSSDLKTEAACFAIFILLGITCQSLFTQGFWNTYNKTFADLKHLHQETQLSETLIKVHYNFQTPSKEINGQGFVINSSENHAIIWNKKQFVRIEKQYKITKLIPERTLQKYKINEVYFSNINPDSLQRLLLNKPIISLAIQSNHDFEYIKNQKPETGKKADLEYITNPLFKFKAQVSTIDTSNLFRKRILLHELEQERKRVFALKSEKETITEKIKNLENSISDLDLYEREKAVKQLKQLRSDLATFPEIEDHSPKLLLQIQGLQTKVIEAEKTQISGYLTFLVL